MVMLASSCSMFAPADCAFVSEEGSVSTLSLMRLEATLGCERENMQCGMQLYHDVQHVLWCAGRELQQSMSMQSKTVTGTAMATPSLSILVEALTAANLTGASPWHAPHPCACKSVPRCGHCCASQLTGI